MASHEGSLNRLLKAVLKQVSPEDSSSYNATEVHPSAVVAPDAEIGTGVEIGPFCYVGSGVKLGDGCRLMNHVSVQGPSTFGKENLFHPFCSIGGVTQDLKYQGEPTLLEVGDRNEFREYVSVNRGTGIGEKTTIGNDNLLLSYAHVAHNCQVGSHCILSNNGTLGGHVVVEDHVIVSGLAAVHQFCRIGQHSLIGGCSKIVQDVPPYFIADGNPASVRALNLVGLQRRGFDEDRIRDLRWALKKLYDPSLNTSQALDAMEEEKGSSADIRVIIDFVRNSERGIIR